MFKSLIALKFSVSLSDHPKPFGGFALSQDEEFKYEGWGCKVKGGQKYPKSDGLVEFSNKEMEVERNTSIEWRKTTYEGPFVT